MGNSELLDGAKCRAIGHIGYADANAETKPSFEETPFILVLQRAADASSLPVDQRQLRTQDYFRDKR